MRSILVYSAQDSQPPCFALQSHSHVPPIPKSDRDRNVGLSEKSPKNHPRGTHKAHLPTPPFQGAHEFARRSESWVSISCFLPELRLPLSERRNAFGKSPRALTPGLS
ncbi:hypothetical protein PMIN06_004323 [Paraphaeosphaeria minitans]